MKIFRELTSAEHAELTAFAMRKLMKDQNADWKAMLREEWTDGTTLGILQSLRSSHGPDWLENYSLADWPASMFRQVIDSKV